MIKCYFLDVKSITSDVPRSSFTESNLEKIADSILETDGLICPLIVQEIGVNKYTVIDGHQEYYAAVIAKQKNIQKAEMVNAFIIPGNTLSSAIEQLKLLRQPLPNTVVNPTLDRHILTEVLSSTIDRLLPAISASIATQLEPLVKQLDEQKQILDIIKLSEKSSTKEPTSNVKDIDNPPVIVDPLPPPDSENIKPPKRSMNDNKNKAKAKDRLPDAVVIIEPILTISQDATPAKAPKATTKSRGKSKPENDLPLPTLEIAESSQQPDIIVASLAQITKPTESNKTANSQGSDSDKSSNALSLINTLDPAQLKIKLERSGIATAKTSGKLVETIITNRSIQPAQKFESWDAIVNAKITGLTATIIKKIIDKLK
jgi:ParB-like chromosome segregation protein Spo0J